MPKKHYAHWREVDEVAFRRRWPNFSPPEIACKGTGQILVNEEGLDALQRLRGHLGKPLILTSAYRSPVHNASLPGAAPNSRHLNGDAFDVIMSNHDPQAFESAAKACGFRGIGHYPGSGFMHIDTREKPARWHTGGWFPARPAGARVFAPEAAAVAAPPAGLGRAIGLGVASAVTALADNAGALVEVAQHPLTGFLPWLVPVLALAAVVALVLAALRNRQAKQYDAGEPA